MKNGKLIIGGIVGLVIIIVGAYMLQRYLKQKAAKTTGTTAGTASTPKASTTPPPSSVQPAVQPYVQTYYPTTPAYNPADLTNSIIAGLGGLATGLSNIDWGGSGNESTDTGG